MQSTGTGGEQDLPAGPLQSDNARLQQELTLSRAAVRKLQQLLREEREMRPTTDPSLSGAAAELPLVRMQPERLSIGGRSNGDPATSVTSNSQLLCSYLSSSASRDDSSSCRSDDDDGSNKGESVGEHFRESKLTGLQCAASAVAQSNIGGSDSPDIHPRMVEVEVPLRIDAVTTSPLNKMSYGSTGASRGRTLLTCGSSNDAWSSQSVLVQSPVWNQEQQQTTTAMVLRPILLFALFTVSTVLMLLPGTVLSRTETARPLEEDLLLDAARLAAFSVGLLASRGLWTAALLPCAPLNPGSAAPPSKRWRRRDTPVYLALGLGSLLFSTGGFILCYGVGQSQRVIPAGLAHILIGAGESLLLTGMGILLCVEVGIVAGTLVSLDVLLFSWLLVNAMGILALPLLRLHLATLTVVTHRVWYNCTAVLLLFVGGLLLLSGSQNGPTDASLAHRSPSPGAPPPARKSIQRRRSISFLLRSLTVSQLTAALMLIHGYATALPPSSRPNPHTPPQEIVKGGTAWSPSYLAALVFCTAAAVMPLCTIPAVATRMHRYTPAWVCTTLLCLAWAASFVVTERTPTRRHRLTSLLPLCAVLTGAGYAAVVTGALQWIDRTERDHGSRGVKGSERPAAEDGAAAPLLPPRASSSALDRGAAVEREGWLPGRATLLSMCCAVVLMTCAVVLAAVAVVMRSRHWSPTRTGGSEVEPWTEAPRTLVMFVLLLTTGAMLSEWIQVVVGEGLWQRAR